MLAQISWDFTVYDFDTDEITVVRSRPSDYLRMEMALDKQLVDMTPGAQQNYNNYGVLYSALDRMGKLGDYGVTAEMDMLDGVKHLTERVGISFKPVEVDEAPLARVRKK